MKTLKTLWMPLLLGMLLMSTMAGVASARPNARPQQQAWRVLTVGTGACIPARWPDDWFLVGGVSCASGTCMFNCPVSFPAAGEQAVGAVNVKRFTMYAYNNDPWSAAGMAAKLWKVHPPSGAWKTMAHVQTYSDSDEGQAVMDTTIANNPVYRVQSPHIALEIDTATYPGDIVVAGFYIHYTWM